MRQHQEKRLSKHDVWGREWLQSLQAPWVDVGFLLRSRHALDHGTGTHHALELEWFLDTFLIIHPQTYDESFITLDNQFTFPVTRNGTAIL
jgi:hypothetical protein